MICNSILFYHSRKGNTKAMVNLFEGFCEIDSIDNIRNYNLKNYSTVIFATSTYGRGVPPNVFFEIRDLLVRLKGKKIGLLGSGNTHYEFFCGALDLLDEMLSSRNEVIFKYKFEGYPRDSDFEEMKRIIRRGLL